MTTCRHRIDFAFISQIPNALRLSMVSLSSQADLDLRQVFTQVGTYKGTIVAIKRVSKKCVDLTRGVRKELKQVKINTITFIS